jgi:glycosyltransferase involved in cell wall biosynthesis
MKLALVSSSFGPGADALGRQVESLARGLARHGVAVDVVTQEARLRSGRVTEQDGLCIRRFPLSVGRSHFGVARGLWEYVRRNAGSWDVVHLHCSCAAVGLAVGGVPARRLVFTPHIPIQRLVRWPYGHVARTVIERAAHTVPLSEVEAALVRSNFPRAAGRVRVMPVGADVAAIQAAMPLPCPGDVVLAVGRLERREGVERTIAAMASLERRFRLVIVGGGPAERWLRGYADDLRVSPRVYFTGPVEGAHLYRWLRTARVLVTLSELEPSGLRVLEALSAGVSVVASDLPLHRETASITARAGVWLVASRCSPLRLSDAIAGAAEAGVPHGVRRAIPSAEAAVEKMLPLYQSLTGRGALPPGMSANGSLQSLLPARNGEADMMEAR